MKKSKRCIHCKRLFHLNPRVKNQTYCSRAKCQRARKSLWQKHKMATDPDYRRNQKESQKTWRENNPSYWRRYRRNNPKYCRRNQLLQVNYYRLKAVALSSAASRLKIIFNLKVAIRRLFTLFFNILYDYFISYITRGSHKVAPCPHVATPEGPTLTLVFHQDLPGAFPFDGLY